MTSLNTATPIADAKLTLDDPRHIALKSAEAWALCGEVGIIRFPNGVEYLTLGFPTVKCPDECFTLLENRDDAVSQWRANSFYDAVLIWVESNDLEATYIGSRVIANG